MRIRQLGDPILREVSRAVAVGEIKGAEVHALIERMKTILNGIQAISSDNGNALSAPQVGHLLRVILLRIDGQFHPMINPIFSPISKQKFDFEEECFSLYEQRGTVSRYLEIKLEYLDPKGAKQSISLSGENAGLVQHEIDHLNGVLFLDHLADGSARSIETILQDNPGRLRTVRHMIDYMRG